MCSRDEFDQGASSFVRAVLALGGYSSLLDPFFPIDASIPYTNEVTMFFFSFSAPGAAVPWEFQNIASGSIR